MWDSIGHQYKTQATSSTAIFIPFPYSALAAAAATAAATTTAITTATAIASIRKNSSSITWKGTLSCP
ncbi:hypothetical protein MXE38_03920 [Anaerobiospirillum sp. NML120448]|uniref:hypothetical protein n=1 Tax=Anaerobiospirillum sp. NML120448 TaxID=2932816 RepID=UPI001FF2A936|nr:hypothetical protein [Anaerobiospirillum sp. NML120448]MCK0514011.1 hypothetical protein [Anaerobiospirillum sp. NML120448]